MWQDWIIAAVQVVLALSLLPSIFHDEHKPTVTTSCTTAAGLYVLTLVYATLAFWFSALMSAIIAVQWTILAFQRYRLNKRTQG